MPTTYAIPDGRTVMAATLWTGNGSTQSISNAVNGVSFQPDLVWYKSRSNSGYDHYWIDSVRGVLKWIGSSSTSGELTIANSLTSFNSNGFTLGSDAGGNQNTLTYVGWQWKAGGAAVTNTAGSITSQVSANTTAGFSVVTFTGNATAGSTVGHGLSVAPQFVIYKGRNNGNDWWSYHVGLTSAAYAIQLNTTNAQNNTVNFFNSTAPNSSVLTLGYWSNATGFNNSGVNYVAYCFAPVAGYSAFGSYTGNGSTDGPFVYLGFRPRFILTKATQQASQWFIWDSARSEYNAANDCLFPESSQAETANNSALDVDFLSNGFKIRNTGSGQNNSTYPYIYMAFCENPFKFANAR